MAEKKTEPAAAAGDQWVQIGAKNIFGLDGAKHEAGAIIEIDAATADHFDELDMLKKLTASSAAKRIEEAAKTKAAEELKAAAIAQYRAAAEDAE